MSTLTYRYVALTDTGLRRATNQDSGFASSRLLAVADGMGGAAAGDLASAETMHIIRQLDTALDVDALDALERAVTTANTRLGDLIRRDPAVEGMGTTLEAMVWDGEKLATAHLGDSRTYRLRGGELTQLNPDHTFVQSLVDEGKISPDEARVHPHRSLLLRALLGRDDNNADFSWLQPVKGDRYLLCSDGLTDMVPDDVIKTALAAETIDIAATELVRLALEAGGVDNVTVVIAEFVEAGTEPDKHLSSSDGQPQLVGAAAQQARPRTGAAASGPDPVVAVDPEELRYAPRPPSRLRWLRILAGIGIVAGLILSAGALAYNWSQSQYYVGADKGEVVVFRGVDVELPGITLNHVDETTGIKLTSLTDFQRKQVEAGIEASSKYDALRTIAALDVQPPEPRPSPSPSTPEPTSTDDARPAAVEILWRP